MWTELYMKQKSSYFFAYREKSSFEITNKNQWDL